MTSGRPSGTLILSASLAPDILTVNVKLALGVPGAGIPTSTGNATRAEPSLAILTDCSAIASTTPVALAVTLAVPAAPV